MKKLYKIEFDKMHCMDGVLFIAAESENEALKIATETLEHTYPKSATLIEMDTSKVVFFWDGDY